MFQLDEKMMSDNRALITVNKNKVSIDKNLKNGMINYTSDTSELFLTIPRSKDYSEYKKLLLQDTSGKVPDNLTFTGSITIEKNLTILGDTTSIDTTNLAIEDNVIDINKNETGNGISLNYAGIQINRGTKGVAKILFSEPDKGFLLNANNSDLFWVLTEGIDKGKVKTFGDIFVKDPIDPAKEYKVFHQGNLEPPLYKTTDPSLVAVGGLPVGYLPPAAGIPITDLMYNLLHPYTQPIVTIGTSQSFGLYEKGTSFSNINFSTNITKKSSNIVSLKFYNNGTLINTAAVPPATGGPYNFNYTGPITSDSTITVTANDGTTDTSNSGAFTFTYPLYIGYVDSTVTSPTETQIKAMTKKIVNKSNQSFAYTINTKRMCIAYPMSFGNLVSIYDPNGFNIFSSFVKIDNVPVVCLDGTTVQYKVYVSEPTSQNNFSISYRFS